MSANDSIVELLRDALAGRGTVVARRMFGGVGVYLDDRFFAILDDGILYFKTSERSRQRYETAGSQPFTYTMKTGQGTLISYWRVPDRLFDDPETLADWALEAAAARDVTKRKPATRKAAGKAPAPRRNPKRSPKRPS